MQNREQSRDLDPALEVFDPHREHLSMAAVCGDRCGSINAQRVCFKHSDILTCYMYECHSEISSLPSFYLTGAKSKSAPAVSG